MLSFTLVYIVMVKPLLNEQRLILFPPGPNRGPLREIGFSFIGWSNNHFNNLHFRISIETNTYLHVSSAQ